MNIALRAFWSNEPMPIQEKIKQPDLWGQLGTCLMNLAQKWMH